MRIRRALVPVTLPTDHSYHHPHRTSPPQLSHPRSARPPPLSSPLSPVPPYLSPIMNRSYFPRFGCYFCNETHASKEAHNAHLDEFVPEITEFKKSRLRPPTTHYVNLIRAVRRRAKRRGDNRNIRLTESEFDVCQRWKLYVIIVSLS